MFDLSAKAKEKGTNENFTVSQKFIFFEVQLKFVFRSLAKRYAEIKFL